MPEAWIVEAVRTPIGKHGGALASVRPDDLLAHALSALVDRSGVPKEEVKRLTRFMRAVPTRRARTTATWPAWPSSSPASPWRWRAAR